MEEKEVENSASRATILNKNRCGHFDYLVALPFLTEEGNPRGCLEAGSAVIYLSVPGEGNFMCTSVSTFLAATRGQLSPGQ